VIDNVAVTVEEWPTRRQLESVGLGLGAARCWDCTKGIARTRRSSHYGLVLPDKITIFRGPILQMCPPDENVIRTQIRRTVLHEIAHHFGISDERLVELGAY
jgi:predicted Zn-dependent protease with MMP-like domain